MYKLKSVSFTDILMKSEFQFDTTSSKVHPLSFPTPEAQDHELAQTPRTRPPFHERLIILPSQLLKLFRWLLGKIPLRNVNQLNRKESLQLEKDEKCAKIYKSRIKVYSKDLVINTKLREKLDKLSIELSELRQLGQLRKMEFEMSLTQLIDELNHTREELKRKEELYNTLKSKLNDIVKSAVKPTAVPSDQDKGDVKAEGDKHWVRIVREKLKTFLNK